ncbi:anti-sigma regulatory factor (Ser/Thr protein kinase) [Streptomyces sp. LBL]|uniref:ATP-binding protein n=1 Tax=Streptomyces sp. LBL TaxID=2940562 RepID=UPI002474E3CA|nr:ATP-binding protein [Streptomyces sp. LBL]MDH6629540.1 anti-sigma regulatory factor (Ser/Thr protein kinase) [Streptomyces sp. LBL]
MCEQHGTEFALEPFAAERRGRAGPRKPAEARRAVERAVTERCRATCARCDPDALSDALLVASELTTNAILHGGGITNFHVDVVGRDVRVSVCDRSADVPVVAPRVDRRGCHRIGGHGWPIVCRLAHDVRVTDLPTGGKCVTALVPLS